MKKIYFYDTSKKTKVEFVSLKPNIAKIYVCGPTVYDNSHLGHARSAIAFDLLHRVLKANGYEVVFVKNFTDIDDKIIKKMKEEGKSLEEITTFYIKNYKNDMEILNILPNSFEPKASENFDVSKDKNYGSLSNQASDENSQARVEINNQKRNSSDFALWKFEKASDVSFASNFGAGRPGWHIECSAMIEKHLAYKDEPFQIDIHCGGADLLFPHHENEASQTRCASGQNLAKYWMHNGFVNINGEKMSKSLGNSFFLKDVLKSYSGEVVKFYLLSSSYRANINFNEEDLLASKKRLDKLYRVKKRVYEVTASKVNEKFENTVLEALNDDLNTSLALSFIDEFINSSNDSLDKNPKDKTLKQEIVANIEFIEKVLGFGGSDAFSYFQFGVSLELKKRIEDLISKRAEAKKNKDFAKADSIRDELSAMNISIMDTALGVVWERSEER